MALITGPYPQKLLTLVAAGSPPDVAFAAPGADLVSYVAQGVVLPIDAYVAASKVASADFYAPAWDANVFQGKNWGLPNEVDPNFALLYNAPLLKEVGINGPPTTIQELTDANQKLLQTKNGKITRIGIHGTLLTAGVASG
jgi:maltose-binding protein MalE